VATRSDDPKLRSLRDTRSLNPHPEKVADATFLREEFFDARDAVQVKYEMVRAVVVDGDSVTEATARFGYSRPAYYQALAALAQSGLAGLVAAKPGPRRRHKLAEEVLAWAQAELDADPKLKPAGLVDPIIAQFGIRVHPRSIERALARRREQSKSR
jgi:transposase